MPVPVLVSVPDRLAALLAAGLTLACAPAPAPPTAAASPDDTTPPRCRESIEAYELARLEDGPCPRVLVGDGTHVRLGSLDVLPREPARGAWPAGCVAGRCRFELELVQQGLVLWAWLPGQDSEVPERVWVGIVGAGRIGWLDLWAGAGEPVRVQGTLAGPPHGLQAARCDGGVRLTVAARLAGAAGVEPPPRLAGAAGTFAVGPDGVVRTRALGTCAPLRTW